MRERGKLGLCCIVLRGHRRRRMPEQLLGSKQSEVGGYLATELFAEAVDWVSVLPT